MCVCVSWIYTHTHTYVIHPSIHVWHHGWGNWKLLSYVLTFSTNHYRHAMTCCRRQRLRYNLMADHAFAVLGVPQSAWQRFLFFDDAKYNVGLYYYIFLFGAGAARCLSLLFCCLLLFCDRLPYLFVLVLQVVICYLCQISKVVCFDATA